MTQQVKTKTIWTPHEGQQTEALTRGEFEVLYGGARGGGKTDAGLAWLVREAHNPSLRALVLRRNSDDLRDWVDRANTMYSQLGAVRVGNPPEFRFPSGAIIRTGHLKDENAYTKYQGHEYHRLLLEELTQIPLEKNYLRILSSCRSTVPGLEPRVFATTNPGGVGHMWVRKRFIDPAIPGTTIWDNNRSRVFIQATIDDNPTLMQNDPNYIYTLEALKESDPETYRAWRYGDWDVFAGQVFREFSRTKHVIRPVLPKMGFHHILGMDWGYSESSAYAGYASAVIPMKTEDGDTFNRVITYKEWYGNQRSPDSWAEDIYSKMPWGFNSGVCDPAMHNPKSDGSTPIRELFEEKWKDMNDDYWLSLDRGSNNRIQGVALIHNWLSIAPDGQPYWMITENCLELIRTLPSLAYDQHRIDDVDCFVAGTKVNTVNGDKNIEDIRFGDLVLTPVGYRKVIKDGISGKSKTLEIKLNNGKSLRGTLNHKVFVEGRGLVELQNLKKCGILIERNKSELCHIKPLFTKVLNTANTKIETIINRMELISQRDTPHFIVRFILTTLVKLLKIITSITKTIIEMTIVQKTLKWSVLQIMLNIISIGEKILKTNSSSGGVVQKVKKHLEIILGRCVNAHLKEGSRVQIVKRVLKQNTPLKGIAQQSVQRLKTCLTAFAQYVGISLKQRKITKNKLEPVRIVAVGNLEEKTVYNLTVEDARLYYANNILVTNTHQEDHAYDAMRYTLGSVKFISASEGPVKRGGDKSTAAYPVMAEVKDEQQENQIDLDEFADTINYKRGGRRIV